MLLICGIVSSVWYVITDVIGTLQYPGYRYTEQQFSESLAVGSPVRPLMIALNGSPYNLLVLAFATGDWESAGRTRAGRITAAMLIVTPLRRGITPVSGARGSEETIP
jgi:hypothetical protein